MALIRCNNTGSNVIPSLSGTVMAPPSTASFGRSPLILAKNSAVFKVTIGTASIQIYDAKTGGNLIATVSDATGVNVTDKDVVWIINSADATAYLDVEI